MFSGGQAPDEKDLYIPPTIVLNPKNELLHIEREVFGPVLPILQYDNLDEVLRKEASRPNPLALYIYSADDAEVQYILNNSRSGGVCVNDCITHMLAENLLSAALANLDMATIEVNGVSEHLRTSVW